MKKKSKYNIAVVGAKGAVGFEMIRILEQRKFPVGELRPFGSARTKGQTISFNKKEIPIQELLFTKDEFKNIDIVLSSPGASVSQKFAPHAIQAGAVIIDNTSAFRMDENVPLVVPEINGKEIKKNKGIIANPNCSAIIMLMAVAPLHRKNRIKRIVCATYQAVSGAGATAMVELYSQTEEFTNRVKSHNSEGDVLATIQGQLDSLKNQPLHKDVFPHQIAFNLFSHNSSVDEDTGFNGEESKMIAESKKILGDPKIKIITTCVRVPVFRAHAEAIYLQFEKPMSAKEARKILSKADGVQLMDDRKNNHFPMPIEASGGDDVLVGRIREDDSISNGLALFVAGDQLRKGAALNAVQIAEELIK